MHARIPKAFSGIFRHLLFAVISAAAGVVIGELLINRIYFGELGFFYANSLAVCGNILILSCLFLILWALFNRLFSAIVLGLTLYGVMILADILKLIHFDNPVRPTDLQYLPDLEVIAKSSVSARSFVISLVTGIAIIALFLTLWRKEKTGLLFVPRILTGSLALVLVVCIFVLPSYSTARDWLEDYGIARPESYQFEPRASAQLNGLLVEWAMSAGELSFRSPEGYSLSEVERITHAYGNASAIQPAPGSEQPPNVILFLVESFMDPLDLGVRFTSDPIPTFRSISRKYSSGKIIVPVFGGTSANTEFEALTSLSMSFLPGDSCPYRQYINQDIPALPRLLHQYGYRTMAIPADPPYLFSRREVLRRLGFDSWSFPEADPNIPRTPDDEFASDEAIVDAAINASRAGTPFFILGFTGGTHYPWDYPDYRNSALDLADPMAEPNRSRLKTYINALRVADNSLKKLITYFEKSDHRTVILIMGDHLPPLAEIYDAAHFFKPNEMDEVRQRYAVPAVLWSNFPATKKDFTFSANFIPIQLLQTLGLPPEGIFALSAEVYSHFPVFSTYVQTADGSLFSRQSPQLPFQHLTEDYRIIQYDLLLGKQYALGVPGWGWNALNAGEK